MPLTHPTILVIPLGMLVVSVKRMKIIIRCVFIVLFQHQKGKKRPWTEDEIEAVHSLKSILIFRLPGKTDIDKAQREHPVLQERNWHNIKHYCRNNRSKIVKNVEELHVCMHVLLIPVQILSFIVLPFSSFKYSKHLLIYILLISDLVRHFLKPLLIYIFDCNNHVQGFLYFKVFYTLKFLTEKCQR